MNTIDVFGIDERRKSSAPTVTKSSDETAWLDTRITDASSDHRTENNARIQRVRMNNEAYTDK